MDAALITYRDEATGERTALTAAEVGGWAAATASLLTAECGLDPGSRVAVLLPPHWQTAAVVLGAWSAGCEVAFRPWATAGLAPAGDPLDASFVERRRVDSWLDDVPDAAHRFVLGLAPAGAAVAVPPEGYRDFPTAVRPHLGAPARPHPAPDEPATVDGTTFGKYGFVAAEIARRRGLGRGDRVLVDAGTAEHPLTWLLAPLSAGAALVLARNLDPAARDAVIAAEGITRTLG